MEKQLGRRWFNSLPGRVRHRRGWKKKGKLKNEGNGGCLSLYRKKKLKVGQGKGERKSTPVKHEERKGTGSKKRPV